MKIPSRTSSHDVVVTRNGNGTSSVAVGDASQGEGGGIAARQTTRLVERPNLSLNRNAGPERPSANTGEIPVVTQNVRKTGRI